MKTVAYAKRLDKKSEKDNRLVNSLPHARIHTAALRFFPEKFAIYIAFKASVRETPIALFAMVFRSAASAFSPAFRRPRARI